MWKPALINEGLRLLVLSKSPSPWLSNCGTLPSLTRDCDDSGVPTMNSTCIDSWKPALINEGLRLFTLFLLQMYSLFLRGNLPSLTRDCDNTCSQPSSVSIKSITCGNLPSLTRDCDKKHLFHYEFIWINICGNLPSLTRDCDLLTSSRIYMIGNFHKCGNLPSLTRDCDNFSLSSSISCHSFVETCPH